MAKAMSRKSLQKTIEDDLSAGHSSKGKIIALDEGWLPQVCRIETRSYASPWSKESLAVALSGEYTVIGFVKPDRALAGYLVYHGVADEVHILNIAVDPDCRMQRIAYTLLSWVHNHAKAKGARYCCLEVGRNNQAARKLYNKFGYKQVGTRKAYYHDRNDDALLLTLTLT